MHCPTRTSAILAAAIALATTAPPALAQTAPPQNWPEVKCARYREAWTEALARKGTRGIGQEFLDRHEAFLGSGCTAKADVCPRSGEELGLANILVLSAMNAGMGSTFLPFACRK
jgi:hypothetical protein